MILLKNTGALCLIIASLVALLYNLDFSKQAFGSATLPVAKYLPYWLASIGLMCLMLSIRVRFTWSSFLICIFFIIAILGSLYALLVMKSPLEESYIGRALGGVVFAAFYWLSFDEKLLKKFLRVYLYAFLLAGFMMTCVMILFSEGILTTSEAKIYHPDFLLAISSVLLVSMLIKRYLMGRAFIALVLVAGMLTGSATDKLLVLLVILWFIWVEFNKKSMKWKMLSAQVRVGMMGLAAISVSGLFILIGGAFDYVYTLRAEERDDVVRTTTLLQRWNEFTSSPLFGNWFTGSPLVDVGPLHIPSHSDILDLLAFGGLITIVFLYIPIFRLFLFFSDRITQNELRSWMIFLLAAFVLAAFVNPVLAQPRLAFHLFLVLGVLMGWMVRMQRERNHE